ncbi:hypothetical protein [Lysobacter sp. HA18]
MSPDTETAAMDLFRSPGIQPTPVPLFSSGLAWTRRYGNVRNVRDDANPTAANDADALPAPGVDQDFEEYFFE